MSIILMAGLLVFPSLCLAAAQVPSFSWANEASEHGVPLLRIRFADGGADDFAVLKAFNPIPQGPLERADEIDTCIFEGFLQNEVNSFITLTGCPNSKSFQVQLMSHRLKDTVYIVEDGQAQPLQLQGPDVMSDYIRIPKEESDDVQPIDDRQQISPTGYIMKLKLYYDDNFKEKFGADVLNAMRRVLAHTQSIFKWPSFPTKLLFDIDPEVKPLPGRWIAQKSLKLVSVNNVATVNSNVYFCVRTEASGEAMGVGYLGGGCNKKVSFRSAIQEWEGNDLYTARCLAHELGHNLGMDHDFVGNPKVVRYDSSGNRCTNVGGLLDYAMSAPKDSSLWSSCSIEDVTKTLKKYPNCMNPISDTNVPPPIDPVVTNNECLLPPAYSTYNGVYYLNLNGYSSEVFCVNGLCGGNNGVVDAKSGCKYICGKDSCVNSVDPGVCDLSKLLPGFTGTKTTCVNGNELDVDCKKGMCIPSAGSTNDYTNSCVRICGSSTCDSGVGVGKCSS